MNSLTPVQRRVLEFIVRQVEEKHLPPTHRDIAAHFRWKSNAAANCHLLALEKKGFIRTLPRISRGIELRPAALERMHAGAAADGVATAAATATMTMKGGAG